MRKRPWIRSRALNWPELILRYVSVHTRPLVAVLLHTPAAPVELGRLSLLRLGPRREGELLRNWGDRSPVEIAAHLRRFVDQIFLVGYEGNYYVWI